jgi:hypothetical protein
MERETNHRKQSSSAEPRHASPLRETVAAILLGLTVAAPLYAMDWLAERRQQVEQMTPADKEELNEKYEKFLALPPDEQEQLRVLHQKLDTDPQGDKLRGVMHRYYDWLKTLSPGERADLLSQPETDRLATIKKIKQHQEALAVKLPDGSHLAIADIQVLSDWVKKYASVHEAELSKELPAPRHGEFHGNDKAQHDRPGQFSAWRPWLGAKLPNVSQEEIDDLAHQLTSTPRKAIEGKPTLAEKTELIHEWVQAIWRQRSAGGRFGGGPGRNVNAKELARFFEHDLSKQQQDELSHITDKEEQHRELRKLYFQHRRPTEPSANAGGEADQQANKTGSNSSSTSAPPEKQPAAEQPAPAKK